MMCQRNSAMAHGKASGYFNTTNASPVLTTIPVLAASPVKKTTKTVKLPTQKTIRKTIVSKKKPITVKKMTVKKDSTIEKYVKARKAAEKIQRVTKK